MNKINTKITKQNYNLLEHMGKIIHPTWGEKAGNQ